MKIKLKFTIYFTAVLFCFGLAKSAGAAVDVYYSVGQNTSNHETGAGTVTVSGTTATFSIAQTSTNMGVGDVIDYDSDNKKCYISGKTSETVWSCTNATGGTPTAASSVTVNSVAHAFSSLSAALPSGAGGAKTLLGNVDLTAIDVQLNIPCYYDSGADTSTVYISGWTTDATRYIRVYTPSNTATEANRSQRHNGKWSADKYRIEVTTDGVNVSDDFVRIDGLQIKVTTTNDYEYAITITPESGANIQISNNILQGVYSGSSTNGMGLRIGWFASGSRTAKIWNNTIYGFINGGSDFFGIQISSTWTIYAYNNTVYNSYYGIYASGTPTVFAKNNIAYNNTNNWSGSFDSSSTNNLSGPGSDADIPTTNAQNGVSVTFVNTTGGSEDFHLQSTDTGAKNNGTNLSADGGLPFSTDIDSQSRTVDAWDIGADEYSPSGNFTISAWVKPVTSIATKAIMGKAEEMRVATNASSQPLCQIKNNGTWQTAATSSQALTVGEWAHVMCTYDKITLRVYVDGILRGEQALTVSPDDTNSIFEVGHDASASSTYGYYSGLVDSFRFFTYAMTEAQAKTEFNFGKSIQFGSSGATSGTGSPTNAASGEYCVPGDTTSCAPPVAEWKMDEKVSGNAQTLYDTSGNGNNGTSYDGANDTGMDCSKPGKFGTGCEFDGVDDSIEGAAMTPFPTFVSMSAWIKVSGSQFGSNKNIVRQYLSGRGYLLGLIRSGGVNGFQAYIDGANPISGGSAPPVDDNKWHHLAATYDGSYAKIYMDGRFITQAVATAMTDPSNNLEIGHGGGFWFGGSIDNVRIYNYARTPAQIAWEYNKGKPIAHWKMDEGSGSDVHDEGASLYHGTTAGGVTWVEESNCKNGDCLYFDGLNLSQVTADAPDNMSNLTACAWINADGLSNPKSESEMFIFNKGWHLEVRSDGTLRFQMPTSSSYPALTTTNSITPNQWYRICVVYQGVGVTPKIYINAEDQAGTGFSGGGTQNDDSANALYISSTSNEYYGNFYGYIDDPKIYNFALTAEQIKLDYNGEAVGFK